MKIMYVAYRHRHVRFVVFIHRQITEPKMNTETLKSENGTIHQLAMDIDRVINALEYAESDPEVAYKPAALIKICINQLKKNLSVLNNDLGHDWPENK